MDEKTLSDVDNKKSIMVILENMDLKYLGLDVNVSINTDTVNNIEDVYIVLPRDFCGNTDICVSKILKYLREEGFLRDDSKIETVMVDC